MRQMRMTLAALTVLLIGIGAGDVKADGLDVRFDASINTPEMSIRVGNTPHGRYEHHRRRPLPARRVHRQRLTRFDWKIADRLAWYTGVPERKLIRLRRQGYRWSEIGRWLGVPRQAVYAARHKKTWKRFIREERRYARRRNLRGRRQSEIYYDGR